MPSIDQGVLLFKGSFQYGAVNRFIDDMEHAYREMDVPVTSIHLASDDDAARCQLVTRLNAGKPLFALGVNGIGQFSVNDRSIYDVGAFPHVSWLVDHPVYHMERLQTMPKSQGVLALVDQDHDPFIEASLPRKVGTTFLPHAGSKAKLDEGGKERPIDIVFCGTGSSPEKARIQWNGLPRHARSCIEMGIEIGARHPRQPLMDVVTQAFSDLGQEPDRTLFLGTMREVERYLRTQDRWRSLKALDEAGVRVDIFGTGWDFAAFERHRVHGSVDFETALELFLQAKAALNISWFFTCGAHERIFSAMLNGCVAVTNSSRYLDSLPNFRETAEVYEDELSLVNAVQSLLADEKKTKDVAEAGRRFASNGHTFKHRAAALHQTMSRALSDL